MNDRFRFRVWYEPKGITRDEPIMIYNAEDTYDCMAGEPVIIYKSCFGDVLEDDEYTIMQCTGLKDKNGKLIYEGDIVKFKTELFGKPKQIIWDECRYMLKNTFIILCDMEIEQFGLEVIGNIYENKSLLEE